MSVHAWAALKNNMEKHWRMPSEKTPGYFTYQNIKNGPVQFQSRVGNNITLLCDPMTCFEEVGQDILNISGKSFIRFVVIRDTIRMILRIITHYRNEHRKKSKCLLIPARV